MYSAYHAAATAIYRRAAEGEPSKPENHLPPWSYALIFFNIILFLPLFFFVEYTIRQVFPVLATVENENPPAYEPVALNDAEDGTTPRKNAPPAPGHPEPVADGSNHTVTASLRGCHRLLKAQGNFSANFRGLACFLAQGLLTAFLMTAFGASLGGIFVPLASLFASLALVQFGAAWVHIVISPAQSVHFWRRLPPFRRTFDATWRPVTLYWAACEVTRWTPIVLAHIVGIKFTDPSSDAAAAEEVAAWKIIAIALSAIAVSIFAVIPAHIILTRVQASLLPVDVDTILPFDRSFEGKVEPEIVGGKGYVSLRDAWATFSRSAWRRIVKLYVKIYFISLGLSAFVAVFITVQFMGILAYSK